MSGRADREYVKNRVFAVGVPTGAQKARLRFPTVRQKQRLAVEHPAKVDAVVNTRCPLDDFPIVAKALTDGENAGQQKRRIDRRDLRIPASLTGLCVQPVIEPAALLEGAGVEEA